MMIGGYSDELLFLRCIAGVQIWMTLRKRCDFPIEGVEVGTPSLGWPGQELRQGAKLPRFRIGPPQPALLIQPRLSYLSVCRGLVRTKVAMFGGSFRVLLRPSFLRRRLSEVEKIRMSTDSRLVRR